MTLAERVSDQTVEHVPTGRHRRRTQVVPARHRTDRAALARLGAVDDVVTAGAGGLHNLSLHLASSRLTVEHNEEGVG